jgi:hypothetical protein
MIDLFTVSTFLATLVSVSTLSGINFIKNKNQENLKLGLTFSISLFLLNLYIPSPFHLLLIIFLNKPRHSIQTKAYLSTVTAIAFINSTFDNFSYIIFSNIILITIFFFAYSKIIFKNNSKTINFRLDQLKWANLNSSQDLQNSLAAMTPGHFKSFKIDKIDTIDESIYVTVTYET